MEPSSFGIIERDVVKEVNIIKFRCCCFDFEKHTNLTKGFVVLYLKHFDLFLVLRKQCTTTSKLQVHELQPFKSVTVCILISSNL